MAIADLTWVDALKYGPAGLAGIATVWTAGLLRRELGEKEVRPEARRLIAMYMGFTTLLMIISGAFAAYDTSQNSSNEMKEKLAKIDSIASSIDASLFSKAIAEPQISANEELKQILSSIIDSMCGDVGRIGKVTGDDSLGEKCKASKKKVPL